MRVRKRAIEVQAVRWNGSTFDESTEWILNAVFDGLVRKCGPILSIETLEGGMTAQAGDWIIQGIKGELYPIKPDIFEKTYEQVYP